MRREKRHAGTRSRSFAPGVGEAYPVEGKNLGEDLFVVKRFEPGSLYLSGEGVNSRMKVFAVSLTADYFRMFAFWSKAFTLPAATTVGQAGVASLYCSGRALYTITAITSPARAVSSRRTWKARASFGGKTRINFSANTKIAGPRERGIFTPGVKVIFFGL